MPQGITIFVPDQDPNGIKIIGLNGWNGKAFVIPRSKLRGLRDRAEINAPAIYYLFGEGENPSRQHVYIGESENGFKRLLNHDDNKDFWSSAVVFIGTDLDRADVKYLENQSVRLAKNINRYEIENQIEPLENKLTEIKKAGDDDYFEKIVFIMAVFGYALFQGVPKPQTTEEIYTFKTEDAVAKGTLLDNGEFVVYAGSTARIRVTPNFEKHDPGIREKLEDSGVLKRQEAGKSFEFLKDYIFTSPSAAGDTVAGRSVNGWTAWKDGSGKTLDERLRKAS